MVVVKWTPWKDGKTPIAGEDYKIPDRWEDGYTPQKWIDYFDGQDGYTPTTDDLLALILPNIPEPIPWKDGKDGIDGENVSEDKVYEMVEKVVGTIEVPTIEIWEDRNGQWIEKDWKKTYIKSVTNIWAWMSTWVVDFIALRDTPSSYVWQAGKFAKVKADETGLEFAAWGGGGGAVDSVNWQTGVVVLDADDIDETASRIWFTGAEETKLAWIEAWAEVNTIDTVTDTAEIDLTITARALSASVVSGSIDESKLDASVNASLDLADSAVQPAWLSNYFNKTTDDSDDITEGATKLFMDTTEQGKLANITVTQPVDLDQMEIDIAALANGMVYKGNWAANAGTFPGSGSAKIGWFYTVSVWGTVDGIVFNVDDRLIAIANNASTTTYAGNWTILDATDAVTSVFGRVGNVVSANGDYTASQVTNVPAGDISATTVQAAITELDNEKQPNISFWTGVQTALWVNVGSAGAPVLFNGAGGTPSSMTATNLSGTATALNIWGNAATVTTNANLTGVVTSTGNATAIADAALSIAKTSGLQTALDAKAPLASPTFTGTVTLPSGQALIAPALGTPASGIMTNVTGTATGLTSGITNALKSATTTVDVSAATAPSSGQALVATSSTAATWQTISGGYWDFALKLSSDFTVTNSTTLTDVTWFSVAVTNWDSWYIEVIGSSTASDTAGDIKADLWTTGTWSSGSSYSQWYYYNGGGILSTRAATAFGNTTQAFWNPNNATINNGDATVRPFNFTFQFVATGSGNVTFQIANANASSGRTSTIKAGSYFLARKLT